MGNIACFLEICVFSNLLGVAEMILQLAQRFPEYSFDPYENFHEASHTRKSRKVG